jgi:hypothetical protein
VVSTVGAIRLDVTLVALSFTLTVMLCVTLSVAFSLALTVVVALTGFFAITNILHVAIIGAARTVAVTSVTATIVVAIATGRQLAGRTTRRGARAATTG